MTNDHDYVEGLIHEWMSVHGTGDYASYALVVRLIRAGRILDSILSGIAKQNRLGARGDYEVLAAIRRSGESGITPTQLAATAQVTTAGMTGRLDRLEASGLILRDAHPEDRRSIRVKVTPQGEEVADSVFGACLKAADVSVGLLSPEECTRLSESLSAVLQGLGDVPFTEEVQGQPRV